MPPGLTASHSTRWIRACLVSAEARDFPTFRKTAGCLRDRTLALEYHVFVRHLKPRLGDNGLKIALGGRNWTGPRVWESYTSATAALPCCARLPPSRGTQTKPKLRESHHARVRSCSASYARWGQCVFRG